MQRLARVILLVFSLYLGLSAVADPEPAAGRPPSLPAVAVFSEPDFLNNDGVQAPSPGKMVEELRGAGFRAEALGVRQLSEPGRLTPAKYAAVVLPYGDAFPLDAYPALKKYHEAGGVFVLTGDPFRSPTTLIKGEWQSPNGGSFFLHDAKGIGTGGFRKVSFTGELHTAENPLGLTDSDLFDISYQHNPVRHFSPQGLNVSSLPPEDKVIPLINLVNAQTNESLPVAAIIQHRCKEFNGAIDIWMGPVTHNLDAGNAYLTSQMMLRGIAWALRTKGIIEPAEADAVMQFAGAMKRPTSLPSGLEFKTPKTWASYLPKSSPPARHLLAVDASGLEVGEKQALASLQGLTSRRQPRIWLMDIPWWLNHKKNEPHAPNDQLWLDWHVQKGYFDGYDKVTDWKSLFTKFRDEYKGAVVADPNLYQGDVLAANVAACEDLIFTTPEVARELGIPIKIDLRGKFKTFAEGLTWVWNTYGKQMNPRVSSYTTSRDLEDVAFAYQIQWKAVMFWVAGPGDADRPGADPVAEKAVAARILSEMEPNGVVLGFPSGAKGAGIGEGDGVELISRYGQALVCTNCLHNASVTSGVQIEQMPSLPPAAPPKLEKDKIYIALALSDGDNEQLWQWLYRERYYSNKRFGEFPFAFGMGPANIDLQPAVVQWFYENAKPGTEFISDVSGIGYMHPDVYGAAYKDPKSVLDGFLSWTNRYLPRLHMESVRTVYGDDQVASAYIQDLGNMKSLFADMGHRPGREGIDQLTYMLDGKPVFRAVNGSGWKKPGFNMLDDIRKQVGTVRPAFVNGFVLCWSLTDFDQVAALYDSRTPDMVFVTPSQLTSLYLENQKASKP